MSSMSYTDIWGNYWISSQDFNSWKNQFTMCNINRHVWDCTRSQVWQSSQACDWQSQYRCIYCWQQKAQITNMHMLMADLHKAAEWDNKCFSDSTVSKYLSSTDKLVVTFIHIWTEINQQYSHTTQTGFVQRSDLLILIILVSGVYHKEAEFCLHGTLSFVSTSKFTTSLLWAVYLNSAVYLPSPWINYTYAVIYIYI